MQLGTVSGVCFMVMLVIRVVKVYRMGGDALITATTKGKVVVHVRASSVTWSFVLIGISLLPGFWSYSFSGCV